MQEKTIEKKLTNIVKTMGGISLKLVSQGLDGMPDRLILLPNGKLGFVELKAPGKVLRPLQKKRKRQLETLGFLVFCLDDPEKIGGILDEIQSS